MESSLRHYIEEALKTGVSHEEIKNRLTAHGWDAAVIDETLAHLSGSEHLAAHPQQHDSHYLNPGDHIHVTYASIKLRVAAQMFDIIITLPITLLALFFLLASGQSGVPLVIPVWLVAIWFYHALLESISTQATFGKRFLGIYVARSEGSVVDFRQASFRFFGKFASILSLGIGIIWANYNPKHQMFHDQIADTVVVVHEPVENTANIAKYTKLGLWSFFVLIILPILGVLIVVIFNLIRPTQIPPSSNSPVVTEPADAQARDASRKADISSYAAALTSYNASKHGYPVSHGDSSFPPSGIFSSTGMLNGFASGFPVDPKNGQTLCQPTTTSPHIICSYHYLSTGTSYVLWAELELPGSGGGVYYADSTGNSGLITSDPTSTP